MSNLNIELPTELHKALRIRAIEEETTLKELVIRYLEEGLSR